jgi:eukaryotic-like serine/threonine-protein kinase
MNDGLKIFAIALVTTIASQLLLGPYILELQGFVPTAQTPTATAKAPPLAADVSLVAPAEELTAPNLEGMSVEAARDRFRDKGIVIIEDAERTDTGAAPGTIVQQRPNPGVPLASKEIRVTVAKEGNATSVPDVIGQSLQDARSALVTAGFEVPEPTTQATADKPVGTILAQQPNPGATAKTGSIVRLTIAGAARLPVPKVQGLYLRKATEALEAAGLTLGKVRRVEHPERGQNYVLGQNPEADAQVEPGTAVDLTVVAPD